MLLTLHSIGELLYIPANKPTWQISRGQFLAQKMRVFTYYRPISRVGKIALTTVPFSFFLTFFSVMRCIHYATTHALLNKYHSIRAFFLFTHQCTF